MQLPLVPYYETCDEDGPCAPYFTGHITDADGRVMCRTDSEERAIELVDCVDGLSANIEALRARLAEVEAQLGRWQGDMNAVLDQRNDYHANVVALRDALDIIQSGFEYRNGDPKMDGTFERFPHVLNRSRMMDIAREALAKLEEPR